MNNSHLLKYAALILMVFDLLGSKYAMAVFAVKGYPLEDIVNKNLDGYLVVMAPRLEFPEKTRCEMTDDDQLTFRHFVLPLKKARSNKKLYPEILKKCRDYWSHTARNEDNKYLIMRELFYDASLDTDSNKPFYDQDICKEGLIFKLNELPEIVRSQIRLGLTDYFDMFGNMQSYFENKAAVFVASTEDKVQHVVSKLPKFLRNPLTSIFEIPTQEVAAIVKTDSDKLAEMGGRKAIRKTKSDLKKMLIARVADSFMQSVSIAYKYYSADKNYVSAVFLLGQGNIRLTEEIDVKLRDAISSASSFEISDTTFKKFKEKIKTVSQTTIKRGDLPGDQNFAIKNAVRDFIEKKIIKPYLDEKERAGDDIFDEKVVKAVCLNGMGYLNAETRELCSNSYYAEIRDNVGIGPFHLPTLAIDHIQKIGSSRPKSKKIKGSPTIRKRLTPEKSGE